MSPFDVIRSAPYRLAFVLAPLLMGIAMVLDLTPGTDSTQELLAAVADQPERWLLTGTLFLLSGLGWTVTGAVLHRVARGRSRLIAVGGVLLATGGAALALLDAAGSYLPALARSGAPLEQQVAVVEQVESTPVLVVIEIVHVAGWALGLVLVAIGLLRSRVVPAWVPVLLLVGFAGMVAFTGGVPILVAATLLVVGMTGLAMGLPQAAPAPQAADPAPSLSRTAT